MLDTEMGSREENMIPQVLFSVAQLLKGRGDLIVCQKTAVMRLWPLTQGLQSLLLRQGGLGDGSSAESRESRARAEGSSP
jgi:hypothetical protein